MKLLSKRNSERAGLVRTFEPVDPATPVVTAEDRRQHAQKGKLVRVKLMEQKNEQTLKRLGKGKKDKDKPESTPAWLSAD